MDFASISYESPRHKQSRCIKHGEVAAGQTKEITIC